MLYYQLTSAWPNCNSKTVNIGNSCGGGVCNSPFIFCPSCCHLWAISRLCNCYWTLSPFVFFSCKPQFIKYLDKAMGRMKEVDNLELKNSLVIWIFFCLVSYTFGFEKWAQQFSKQPLLSIYWATYGTKQYTSHYSRDCMRTDEQQIFFTSYLGWLFK